MIDGQPASRPRWLGASGDIAHDIREMIDEVWNRKNVGLLHDDVAPAAIVHTSTGDRIGPDVTIADVLRTLAGFPDLRTTVHDVIWRPFEGRQAGCSASFRWSWSGHNTGHSVYGPPTGRLVTATGITTLSIRQGMIVEAWIAADTSTIIEGLGIGIDTLLPVLRANRLTHIPDPDIVGEVVSPLVEVPPAASGGFAFDVGVMLRQRLHDIWNRRLLGTIADLYASSCQHHGTGGRECQGHDELMHDTLALLAAFSDLQMFIDDLLWVDDGNARYRAAMRWSMIGTHDGPGVWGRPTGRRVRITGATHQHIEHDQIVEEWVVWDEMSLLAQLHVPLMDLSVDDGDTGDASAHADSTIDEYHGKAR